MNFAQAMLGELNELYSAFQEVVSHLNREGNFQWTSNYPTKDHFRSDIERGNLYVLRESSELIAMAVLDEEQDFSYSKVPWQYSKPAIIHRLVVLPQYRSKSYGKKLVAELESLARAQSYLSIRLDTSISNKASNEFYNSMSYKSVGQVKLESVEGTFVCYEKEL